jgi:KDO2-lipid IV(A) lauroyltransferase
MTWKDVAWRIESASVWLVFQFFRALPVDVASAIGGWLGRHIGYRLPVTDRARHNLRRIFPEMSAAERTRILRGMWDNLGRTAAEFPHLEEFRFGPGERVTVEGWEYLYALRDDDRPGIFFSGHLGNWELNGFCAARAGLPVHLIYRAANNPYLGWLYQRGRHAVGGELIAKGSSGARRALQALTRGGHLAMLVDQKMNDGIAVPFFGIPAMTAPALAHFALKYHCPVVPARIIRRKGAHFHMIFEPALDLPADNDRRHATDTLMRRVNLLLEQWVREHPDQWLWLHNRWPE